MFVAAKTASALTILSSEIRQFDGLYSLNDLHQAAGGARKHQPCNFMRVDTTQALMEEIRTSDVRIIPAKTVRGRGKPQGTYVCKELVYAYAMWISPSFHLKVIRAFDALQGQPVSPPAPAPAPALPARRIRSRDDLSFTARDANGHLQNWRVPSRAGSWHQHVSLGHAWFQEIIQLAQHSPEEAYQALLYAGCSEVLLKHWDHGHEHGFMDLFARFAVAAMIDRDGDLPDLPFTVREMGAEPLAEPRARGSRILARQGRA